MTTTLCAMALLLPFATYLPAYDGVILGRLLVLYAGTFVALVCLLLRRDPK